MSPTPAVTDHHVLTLEEISNLTQEGGQPAETLMNVVALIARRFERMFAPLTCWNRIAPIWCLQPPSGCARNASAHFAWVCTRVSPAS